MTTFLSEIPKKYHNIRVAFVLLPVAIWLSQRTSKNELEAVVLAHPPIRLGRHANKKRQGETFLYPYSSPSLPEMNVL